LRTIPGVGEVASLLIVSEIGDITRFGSPRQLCSFAGLVPSLNQSGEKSYSGGITKQGSKWLRWILVECVHQSIRHETRLQRFFYRLTKKKNRNVAVVATARKMLYIMWFILTKKQPFQA